MGFKNNKDAVGKIIRAGNNKEYEVAGVTRDAHYEGLQKQIRPTLLLHGHNYEFGFFSVKLNGQNIDQAIANVQRHWTEIYPNDPFDYFFLDSFFDKQYQADQKFGNVFGLFSFLAIFIACLGLIGLVAYTTYQKTKEIGIRKVLGASLTGIVGLITKEFSQPVLIASLVAIPVSHLIISKWLEGFAYRAEFAWWMYLLPLVLIVALAFFAISFQSLKAAMANPVQALREE